MRSVVLPYIAGLASGLVLAAGTSAAIAGDVDGTYKKLRVFSQVLTYVQQNYVDELDGDELVYDAITGMLSGLDPHTTFMRPAEYEKLREDTAGEFGGLGIEVGPYQENGRDIIQIEVVHADSPGAHAGLKPADKITAVDGAGMGPDPLATSVKLMRGVPGTRVVLTVERKGWEKPRDIPLVRRQVRVPSVDGDDLGNGVAYVRIRAFQERTDQELAHALADARKRARDQGRSLPAGVVVDLRDNPGGLLDEGVRVADRFLDDGLIVTTQGRNPRNTEREVAHAEGTEPSYPVVLLVNEGTASASEIVAGALQDHKRAVVVGTRTFGKGSVQTLFGLDDGAGLKLTIARYFTPSGRSIQDVGIEPDVPVRPGPDVPPGLQGVERVKQDPQIAAAVDVIAHWPPGKNLARGVR
ncbi:MAG TPA: S41 family peptidase [Myxococcota bacterium]|jgi:carboxyl-terminal processing protease